MNEDAHLESDYEDRFAVDDADDLNEYDVDYDEDLSDLAYEGYHQD